jgi:hypothetical protein
VNFDLDVLQPLRRWMRPHNLRTPGGSAWAVLDLGDAGVEIDVAMPATSFELNFQDDLPAAPFFAVCLAFWHERRTGRRTRARVRIEGVPTDSLHARRLRFALHELSGALLGRLEVEPSFAWPLPDRLSMNRQKADRGTPTQRGPSSEAALERLIAGSAALLEDFSSRVAPLAAFHRQLPLGLFAGDLVSENAVLPHGAAQVDLWGASPDGRVLHLFELKTQKNARMGIVPEAFAYARLLHHVRNGRIQGDGPGLVAARQAESIVMWLIAPKYHPLVLFGGETPLSWINARMAAERVELRILPFSLADDGTIAWLPERGVPAIV